MTGGANVGSMQVSVLIGAPIARVAPDAALEEDRPHLVRHLGREPDAVADTVIHRVANLSGQP